MVKRDLTIAEAIALVAPLKQVLTIFVNLHRMRDHQDESDLTYHEMMRGYQERITVMIWNLRGEMQLLRKLIDGEDDNTKEDDGAHEKTEPTNKEELNNP